MDIRLDGRTAVISGGSKGLGLAMAKRFAASGARVVMLARGEAALREAESMLDAIAPGRVAGLVCDVAKPDDIRRAHEETVARFGPVDILVNNAGESRTGAFETITDEMWQTDLDQKLFAAIRLTRLVWPGMKERRWGRVINVLNMASKAPVPGGAPTGVSRAAGMALTKIIAGEGAPHNVLVNALLVGKIVTDQIARKYPDPAARAQAIDEVGRAVPLGRMGTADEFANMACFLVSEEASYITGTAINVDGGLSPVV